MPAPGYRPPTNPTFHCDLCNKGYTYQNDYENHLSSYDHSHNVRRADLKKNRDPRAAEKAEIAERKAKKQQARLLAKVKPIIVTSTGSGFTKIQDLAKQAEAEKSEMEDVKIADRDAPTVGVGFTGFKIQDPAKQAEAEKEKMENVKIADKDAPMAGFTKIQLPAKQSEARNDTHDKNALKKRPEAEVERNEDVARKLVYNIDGDDMNAMVARESREKMGDVEMEEDGNASENDNFGYEYYDPRYPTECRQDCEGRFDKLKA
ncbi:uncharacterized protein BDZ99DRAFT_232360 [Mytilinidion resinicola]|uniref:C2H2-type domain-containing protein n=1 Tax=Mytilinidion resinicola TaxID=574789 RepID=A0A6A6YZA7_9PEZI|nr:uncharacterized protein BDZ99DRAFT_232360 [Mytilinidion resinicola]KAF2814161.1 hypothetical protein BDZ99DRAFT_232360 [Mytilinidion resinicola]